MYPTMEDAQGFWFCVTYVGAYVAYHASSVGAKPEHDKPPMFNLLVGTLQLIVCRLYGSVLTPYNPFLLVMVSTSTWMKLQVMQVDSYLCRCTICLDALWVGIFVEYGFLPDAAYLVPVFLSAYVLSEFI